MRFLAIGLLAPWLLVLAWAYWAYPKSLPRHAARRVFDAAAIALAAVVAVTLSLMAFDAVQVKQVGAFGPESGSIWKQVMPALYGYFSFMAVLALALWLRWIVWRGKGTGPGLP
jgi:hypothetical protein